MHASLIQRIHDAPTKVVLAVTGGGSRAIADLLEVPGASRTVFEATVPYAAGALTSYLGSPPEQFCSQHTARSMAMAAFERARAYSADDLMHLAGVGATASLASDRPKRGPHRIHVALQTARRTEAWSLQLERGQRTRAEEEALCGSLVLNAVAEACEVPDRFELATLPTEALEVARAEAPPEWTDLLLGTRKAVTAGALEGNATSAVVFPGAFNPLHAGHRRMAQVAEDLLGRPVAWEISIDNVDKPPLDFIEISARLDAFSNEPVWLTRAPTFVEKSRLFPGATFVVGADTIVRIADPKYYAGDPGRAAAAIDAIAARGCRFLVFGREFEGRFHTASDVDLPPKLRALCREVPGEVFREDISSTELRGE